MKLRLHFSFGRFGAPTEDSTFVLPKLVPFAPFAPNVRTVVQVSRL